MEPPADTMTNLTDPNPFIGASVDQNVEQLFQRCMIDNLREGVIFVDRHLTVTLWNRAAENLTGIRSGGIINSHWLPSQIGLKDRFEKSINDAECPVAEAIEKAEQKLIPATVSGRGGRQIAIELHAIPVIGHNETVYGAAVFLHDQSSQVDLEQQVLTLYAHATRDQLTGVSNRAHFERSLDARVKECADKTTIFSLIVADIDFFKKINDEYGHHVGDHALMSFAKMLQKTTRVEDLVARYGGEEFVIICPDCQVEDAVKRAEDIRSSLEQTPLAVLNGKCITASFGVTQFEPGDSATSIFVRADQALLNAKESGRNQVQSLQTKEEPISAEDMQPEPEENKSSIDWKELEGHIVKSVECETVTPIGILIEKIKGFVFDSDATIVLAEPNHIRMKVEKVPGVELRRFSDRNIPLLIDIEVKEDVPVEALSDKNETCSRIRVAVLVARNRDRRHRELDARVTRMLTELRSHLSVTFLGEHSDLN